MIIEEISDSYFPFMDKIGQFLFVSYIPNPTRLNMLEFVLTLGIMIIAILLEISLLYVVFNKCVRTPTTPEHPKTPSQAIRYSSGLLILLESLNLLVVPFS